jgi:hypothetical protein
MTRPFRDAPAADVCAAAPQSMTMMVTRIMGRQAVASRQRQDDIGLLPASSRRRKDAPEGQVS